MSNDPGPNDLNVTLALRQLPLPRAPETLLPRVMAAAGLAAEPWYRRAWLYWPASWRMASTLLLLGALLALAVVLPAADQAAGRELLLLAGDWPARFAARFERVSAALGAVAIVWRLVVQPLAGYLIALAVMTSMACAAAGAVLVYMTSERMSGS